MLLHQQFSSTLVVFSVLFSLFFFSKKKTAAKPPKKNSSQELRLPERFLQTYIQRKRTQRERGIKMGFNNKKRKSNPSDGNNNNNNNNKESKSETLRKSNRSNSWDKEPKGKRPARGGGKKNNGEGKYGATEYVRENEHFEAYYSAQKICSSDEDFQT